MKRQPKLPTEPMARRAEQLRRRLAELVKVADEASDQLLPGPTHCYLTLAVHDAQRLLRQIERGTA